MNCTTRRWAYFGLTLCLALMAGCDSLPKVGHRPTIYNPFPQLQQVAVLPFFNQSNEPTVDGLRIAELYQTELQKIRGFTVMPVGVVEQYLLENEVSIDQGLDFQQLARDLGVDVLVVGSITDFSPYNPPRMGLAINWYAANPGFHPIPAGYGLPWGTSEEEFIPDELVWAAEFELAKEQLKTQQPGSSSELVPPAPGAETIEPGIELGLPADWPDPQGFIPPAPMAKRPPRRIYRGPLIEQVRQYDAADTDLLTKLQTYYHWQQDTRTGGWRGYLQRSEDFTRFCCYLHLSEMLAARGGVDQSALVLDLSHDR